MARKQETLSGEEGPESAMQTSLLAIATKASIFEARRGSEYF
jgi:hypothetical protein